MVIGYNQNIIKKFKEFDITVDFMGSTIFIIFALVEKRIDLLEEFDDKNKARRALILYRLLERHGLLNYDKEAEILYKPTDKAIDFVEFIKNEFKIENKEISAEVIAKIEVVEEDDLKTFVQEYINLFPPGQYHGKLLRMPIASVMPRMIEFLDMYKRDHKTILGATKMYINSQRDNNNFQFCQNSMYFIWKADGQGSKTKIWSLEGWCQQYEEKLKKNELEIDTSSWDIA